MCVYIPAPFWTRGCVSINGIEITSLWADDPHPKAERERATSAQNNNHNSQGHQQCIYHSRDNYKREMKIWSSWAHRKWVSYWFSLEFTSWGSFRVLSQTKKHRNEHDQVADDNCRKMNRTRKKEHNSIFFFLKEGLKRRMLRRARFKELFFHRNAYHFHDLTIPSTKECWLLLLLMLMFCFFSIVPFFCPCSLLFLIFFC